VAEEAAEEEECAGAVNDRGRTNRAIEKTAIRTISVAFEIVLIAVCFFTRRTHP
jgi:hypothetical protein